MYPDVEVCYDNLPAPDPIQPLVLDCDVSDAVTPTPPGQNPDTQCNVPSVKICGPVEIGTTTPLAPVVEGYVLNYTLVTQTHNYGTPVKSISFYNDDTTFGVMITNIVSIPAMGGNQTVFVAAKGTHNLGFANTLISSFDYVGLGGAGTLVANASSE